MNFNSGNGGLSQWQHLSQMLETVTDPAKKAAAVKEISASLEKLAAERDEVEKIRQAQVLEARSIEGLKVSVQASASKHAKAAADLLTDQSVFETRKGLFDQESARIKAALAAREQATLDKERALAGRENSLTLREKAAAGLEAKAASLVSEYEAKIANLKKLIS